MGALQIGAVGLVLSMAAVLLKDLGFRGAAVFSAFGLVALLSLCTEQLLSFSQALAEIAKETALLDTAVSVLKITGVGILMGVSADVCRELGETGIARGVSLAGRLEILTIALPYLRKIIALGVELLQ